MFRNIKNNNHFFVLVLVLLLISVAVMRYLDSFLISEYSPNGIISFELAKDSYMSAEMIDAWDATAKTAAGLSIGFDFLFLIIYASFISLVVFKINKQLYLNKDKNGFGKLFLLLPFLAAFFDIIENIALIKLLLGDIQQKWSLMANYFAIAKFGLLIVAIAYILIGVVILIFRKKR